ncbi:MAG TPA: hypothetical protein VGO90_00225 [Chthoniobacteraceae bacterium]|jgi:hypothetical protein|nr:hypothetical protein [Chthoniobacteraceae bacterium]
MKLLPLLVLVCALSAERLTAAEPKPLFRMDFEAAAVDQTPEDLMVMAGDFSVKADAGGKGKVLELPGEPLDTYGVLFGPSGQGDQSASARFFGTKKGRKFPSFGVSLGGVGGFRLVVSPAKKALEIYRGEEVQKSVPFEWPTDAWTTLRLQIRKVGAAWKIEGKAWASSAKEPAEWMIALDNKEEPPSGRAGLWGSPYAGTPIRFDDLLLTPAH